MDLAQVPAVPVHFLPQSAYQNNRHHAVHNGIHICPGAVFYGESFFLTIK